MARKPRRDEDETSALYVRLPRSEAEKLDRIAFEHRRPKRDLVRELVADHLSELAPPARPSVRPPSPDLDRVPARPAEVVPAQADDVLTPAQAAELLQTAEDTVVQLAEAGELPGRKLGGEWRFLRAAVLSWLAG